MVFASENPEWGEQVHSDAIKAFQPVFDQEITDIESDLTLTGGKIVHARGSFAKHSPPPLKDLPGWSPVPIFGAPGASV